MKIFKVQDLMDKHPHEYKDNFIHAENNDMVAFLDTSGRVYPLNAKIQGPVLRLFDQLANPWQPGEVIATLPAPAPRPVIPILAYVESVERLVKAIRV